MTTFDESLPSEIRCSAIESLANNRVFIGEYLFKKLLEIEDEYVCMYALGLIHGSPIETKLLTLAKDVSVNKGNSFLDELSLLEKQLE